jgi:type I restriction enzyme S subunit
MSKLQKYESYKDSGVEWIGNIPERWKVVKIKYLMNEKKKTYDINLNCGSISFGKVVYKDDEKIPLSTKKAYQVVEKGNFLVNPLNLNYDLKSLRIALSDLNVVVSSGYIVLDILRDINKPYLNYLLHRFDVAFMKTLGAGVRQTLNYTDISECELIEPPIEEQQKIASFLDTKTEQLDKAIKQKEQLIELLKERKQIVINDAVTKGLDKTVTMKDSGVEWIGKIPKHWEVKKLKYVLSLQNNKTIIGNDKVIALENLESKTGKFIETDSQYDGEGTIFYKGNILFGKLRPYLAKVFHCQENGIAFGDLLVYKAININSIFGFYFMLSDNFIKIVDSSTYGTKMPRASSDYIGNLLFPIPLKQEQQQIVKYIENQTSKIDNAIDLQQKQIDKLKEYKTTLIDSVVTGKVRIL